LTLWRPVTSPVVKATAVVVASTVGQMLLRRAVKGVFGGSGGTSRSVVRRKPDAVAVSGDPIDEAQIFTEMLMLRRVRIRRQP
jgi:hypothetical protein